MRGRRIRELLAESEPDPTMAAALPPGAWWARANAGACLAALLARFTFCHYLPGTWWPSKGHSEANR
jgi:hypothetical protein